MDSCCTLSQACKKRQRRKLNRKLRSEENIEKLISPSQNIKIHIEKINKNPETIKLSPTTQSIKMTSKMRRKILRNEKFGEPYSLESSKPAPQIGVIPNENDQLVLQTEVILENNDKHVSENIVVPKENDQLVLQTEVILENNDKHVSENIVVPKENDQFVLQTEVILENNDKHVSENIVVPKENDQLVLQTGVIQESADKHVSENIVVHKENDNPIQTIMVAQEIVKHNTIWCLHDDCLTSIISFKSEKDLQLHTDNEHTQKNKYNIN